MSDTIKINGRIVEPGITELSITGERGRFIFHYVNKDGSITCYGGPTGREKMRAFRVERVKTVHAKKQIRRRGDAA